MYSYILRIKIEESMDFLDEIAQGQPEDPPPADFAAFDPADAMMPVQPNIMNPEEMVQHEGLEEAAAAGHNEDPGMFENMDMVQPPAEEPIRSDSEVFGAEPPAMADLQGAQDPFAGEAFPAMQGATIPEAGAFGAEMVTFSE